MLLSAGITLLILLNNPEIQIELQTCRLELLAPCTVSAFQIKVLFQIEGTKDQKAKIIDFDGIDKCIKLEQVKKCIDKWRLTEGKTYSGYFYFSGYGSSYIKLCDENNKCIQINYPESPWLEEVEN